MGTIAEWSTFSGNHSKSPVKLLGSGPNSPDTLFVFWLHEKDCEAIHDATPGMEAKHLQWIQLYRKECKKCKGSGQWGLFTSVEDCPGCAGAGHYFESR